MPSGRSALLVVCDGVSTAGAGAPAAQLACRRVGQFFDKGTRRHPDTLAQLVSEIDWELRGAGRHFCTGLDLSDLDQTNDGELLWRLVRIEMLLSLVWHAPKRTVAVAQGRAWGAGADLLAACEARVVLPGTTLRFPGAQFGIVLGTRRLAIRMGSTAARAVVTEGGELNAQEALACGLATHDQEPTWSAPRVDGETAAALHAATRATDGGDQRDADLAALVRSAARPGLQARVRRYVAALKAAEPRPA
jgi:enoyl-CoA hydratase/carnithine racemase